MIAREHGSAIGDAPDRDVPDRDAPDRDAPDRDAPDRDAPDRDAPDPLDAVDATDVRLYDATDLPWITIVVDHVMSCLGQPWRVLRERLEHAPIRGARVAAILGAMRRMMDGKAQRTKIARKVRASVLGHPALDDTARADRLARAGDELGIDPSEIESLLWIDLAEERPVTLPDGRPDETRLAAYANVDRIQRALRRARHVRIHAWGNAHPLIRTAARYGLLVRVSSSSPAFDRTAFDRTAFDRTELRPIQRPQTLQVPGDQHTVIDIVGPLSLFHQTHVYGRALGSVVPLLSGLERFVVEIDADFGYGMAALRIASPALLPPAPATERGKPSIAAKIASAMERRGHVLVERDPTPIAHGSDRLFPDLAIEVIGPRALPSAPDASTPDTRAPVNGRDLDGANDANESDDDLYPDLASLLAAQMNDAADSIASREIVAALPPADRPDRSRCWFVEVVGFATTEYLTAKLARYEGAGIDRVLLVVDDTRVQGLAAIPRVVPYDRRTAVADLLMIIEASKS